MIIFVVGSPIFFSIPGQGLAKNNIKLGGGGGGKMTTMF